MCSDQLLYQAVMVSTEGKHRSKNCLPELGNYDVNSKGMQQPDNRGYRGETKRDLLRIMERSNNT